MDKLRAAIAALCAAWKNTTAVSEEIEAVLAADAELETTPPAAAETTPGA